MNEPLPEGFGPESFAGFDMTDNEVGEGEMRSIAIELKHNFEAIYLDAEEENEEIFLPTDLVRCLRDFFNSPHNFNLARILVVSPSLYEPVLEIARLVAPSQLENIPTVIS
ncbi:MAG TPA: hypothetical protein VIJ79_06495 [Acidobacteriaceae bacterium]